MRKIYVPWPFRVDIFSEILNRVAIPFGASVPSPGILYRWHINLFHVSCRHCFCVPATSSYYFFSYFGKRESQSMESWDFPFKLQQTESLLIFVICRNRPGFASVASIKYLIPRRVVFRVFFSHDFIKLSRSTFLMIHFVVYLRLRTEFSLQSKSESKTVRSNNNGRRKNSSCSRHWDESLEL